MEKDQLFWIWLSEALGAANRDFRKLIALYENPYELFHAEDSEIEALTGVSEKTRANLQNKSLTAATKILDACEKGGFGILNYADERYPDALKELRDPPVLLYYAGTLPDFNKRLCFGMVGTRRMSAYGLKNAYKISYEIAAVNALIVSGMASGIDGVCAAAALAAKGDTAAILGCGLDVLYPAHHGKLRDEIRRHGVLLSEYPPGTRPEHYHFPVRNRLISGLTQGTVVVEAGIGSGSLITAKNAVMQGRDVFAIPANVGSRGAEGTNGLLRDGANLVLDTLDLLKKYEFVYAETLRVEKLNEAKTASEPDLHYLDRLGVIELTQRTGKSPVGAETVAAPKAEQPPTAPAPARKRTRNADVSAPKPAGPAPEPRTKNLSKTPERQTPDSVIASLSPVQLSLLQSMPDDRAVPADSFLSLGFPYGETIAALTMLEIIGLIQKLPGSLYLKN